MNMWESVLYQVNTVQNRASRRRQFEYLFTDRDEAMFDPKDVADWNKQDSRAYTTPEDAERLAWLQKTMETAVMHCSTILPENRVHHRGYPGFQQYCAKRGVRNGRHAGNQMEPDRGGLNLTTPENRTYGGADYMIAKVGGVWDALGEGREFWNFANSDSHFEISETVCTPVDIGAIR